MSAPDRITIRKPDDFHHHVRDGDSIASVLEHATKRFERCLCMPNLKPPVTTVDLALQYKERILASLPEDAPESFVPLVTLYLTDHTTPEEIYKASKLRQKCPRGDGNGEDDLPVIIAVKFYPAGATTNSDSGVSDVQKTYPALKAMEETGMRLCIHSEVTHGDIFEREPVFIEEVMKPLVRDFPKLNVTMEHISTREAVEYVMSAPDNIKASITCHHLLYNRNNLLVGGIRPHLYCLPILKAEKHRLALVKAATSGSPKFFLGTDSAPHTTFSKECACGCAGVYTAHACIELYATVFANEGKLDLLENFCSSYGADHYGLPRPSSTITLEKKAWTVPVIYKLGTDTVTPLRSGEEVEWSIV